MWRSTVLALTAALLTLCVACGSESRELAPTRGYVFVSLDTLGARHLGSYGSERDTSPFFDRLAERGVLFENAFVQYPSTLVSHMSMFTGLYPQEHGVYPPASVLSFEIASLPERFQAAGYRTAGFTEAGYVSRDFGFQRGFDEFLAVPESTADETFGRGLEFLRRVESDESFFLFLHTYAVHDPYYPPSDFDGMFWDGERPAQTDSSGEFLRDINMGRHQVSQETVDYYRAQYDAEVRYLDGALERLFGELESLGLDGETTVILTSDHGEEFQEHGNLAHSQVYPETLHVPLLVLHPSLENGRRVADLVQSIDIAPTLYELANLPPVDELAKPSGASLVPLLQGRLAVSERAYAYAEVFDQENQKTLIEAAEGSLTQYVTALVLGESGGTWATRRAVIDTREPRLDLQVVSFHRPREIAIELDGEAWQTRTVGTGWQPLVIDLPPGSGRRRIVLSTLECEVPMWLGLGADTRCLSFKVQGAELRRAELFDLASDPEARIDLTSSRAVEAERLAEQLRRYRWSVRATPGSQELSTETVENLKALGYLN